MTQPIGSLGRMTGLESVGRIDPRPQPSKAADLGGASKETEGFGGLLTGLVNDVNRVQHEASSAIADFASGNGENLHEVMLAVSKAELSFKFLMEARNKLVDAYHEVMRMQL